MHRVGNQTVIVHSSNMVGVVSQSIWQLHLVNQQLIANISFMSAVLLPSFTFYHWTHVFAQAAQTQICQDDIFSAPLCATRTKRCRQIGEMSVLHRQWKAPLLSETAFSWEGLSSRAQLTPSSFSNLTLIAKSQKCHLCLPKALLSADTDTIFSLALLPWYCHFISISLTCSMLYYISYFMFKLMQIFIDTYSLSWHLLEDQTESRFSCSSADLPFVWLLYYFWHLAFSGASDPEHKYFLILLK